MERASLELPDQLLKQVLKRHHAPEAALVVHHNRDIPPYGLHVRKGNGGLFSLIEGDRLPGYLSHRPVRVLIESPADYLDRKRAHDLALAVDHREAGVLAFQRYLMRSCDYHVRMERYHRRLGGHRLSNRPVVELQHVFNEILFLLGDSLVHCPELHRRAHLSLGESLHAGRAGIDSWYQAVELLE